MEWPVKAVNATMRIVEQAADYIAANGPLAAIINGAAAGSKVVLTITVAYRVTRVGVTRSASCVRPVV